MHTVVFISVMLVGVLAVFIPIQKAFLDQPDTVMNLDLVAYSGVWYEMYNNAISAYTVERGCTCTFAVYGETLVPSHDNAISVRNVCTLESSGAKNEIEGYVYYKEGELKSKLKLHFYSKGPPWDGNYWVLEVGPINKDGFYDWAIVSDRMGLLLFILARDVDEFDKKYDKDIKKKVKELGFKGFKYKEPIKTKQGIDCMYYRIR